jgi:hypothetical protein
VRALRIRRRTWKRLALRPRIKFDMAAIEFLQQISNPQARARDVVVVMQPDLGILPQKFPVKRLSRYPPQLPAAEVKQTAAWIAAEVLVHHVRGDLGGDPVRVFGFTD